MLQVINATLSPYPLKEMFQLCYNIFPQSTFPHSPHLKGICTIVEKACPSCHTSRILVLKSLRPCYHVLGSTVGTTKQKIVGKARWVIIICTRVEGMQTTESKREENIPSSLLHRLVVKKINFKNAPRVHFSVISTTETVGEDPLALFFHTTFSREVFCFQFTW